MGLLSKAAGRTGAAASETKRASAELDEMGKALRDRIQRLPPKKTAPYTALSLMKAYGSFQAGLCLSLRKGFYSSYATVGLGIEKINISGEKLFTPENIQKKFFKYPDPGNLGIRSLDENYDIWVFPLDRESPWGSVMLLGTANSSLFNPEIMYLILEGILNIINPQVDRIITRGTGDEKGGDLSSPAASSPEAIINRYYKMNPTFSCLVIDSPADLSADVSVGSPNMEKDGIIKKIAGMINFIGEVSALPNGRSLVLMPSVFDRDLIAHRLSASLKVKTLAIVGADDPGKVLLEIQPYL
jgi:hypothetical protein